MRFPADTSGGALPALTTCFGGYRQLVDNIPASAGLSSVDRPQTECPINIALR